MEEGSWQKKKWKKESERGKLDERMVERSLKMEAGTGEGCWKREAGRGKLKEENWKREAGREARSWRKAGREKLEERSWKKETREVAGRGELEEGA